MVFIKNMKLESRLKKRKEIALAIFRRKDFRRRDMFVCQLSVSVTKIPRNNLEEE